MGMSPLETVPTAIGKYRLLAELGHGGMARVFLAVAHGPSGFSKLVVLKMIRVHLADDPDTLEMFLDEARLAGRLNHPNVVHTLEVVEEDGRYLMVMEYLEGQSLASILRRGRQEHNPLSLGLHMRVLIEAMQGLHYAHELKDFDGTTLNLVHRDVSPQNIFVTYDGQIKVLDFGIAKAITSSSETKAGVIKGKIAYMAPEQFLGEKLDRRVDIYGMGAVLWQACTGQRLWKGVPDGQVIHRVIRGEIPLPSSVNADVPPELERITLRALARERGDRYPDALALHDDLDRFVESTSGKVTGRDVGANVATMFADVRAEITSTIEAQLSKAQHYDTAAFDRTAIPAILSTTMPGGVMSPESSGQHRQPPSIAPGVRVLSSVADGEVISGSTRSNVGALTNSIPSGMDAPQAKRKPWVPIVAVLALLGGFAAALWVVPSVRAAFTGETPTGTATVIATASAVPEPPLPPSETASAPVAPDPPAEVVIRIETSPKSAHIYFDDVELATNPATRHVPRGAEVHKIRAESKGYEPRTVEVNSDKDVVVTVELDRIASGGSAYVAARNNDKKDDKPAATAEPTKPPPPATAPPKGTGTAKPDTARDRIKNLDKSNPWDQ